jgi:hypothetical protein
MESKKLNLTLKKVWFDEILEGTKTIEYRENKEYWVKRLQNNDGTFKEYDFIFFKNGYNPDSPFMITKFLECLYDEEDDEFQIYIGDIIETGYLKPDQIEKFKNHKRVEPDEYAKKSQSRYSDNKTEQDNSRYDPAGIM